MGLGVRRASRFEMKWLELLDSSQIYRVAVDSIYSNKDFSCGSNGLLEA